MCKPNGITNYYKLTVQLVPWYWYLDLVVREALYLEPGNSNTQGLHQLPVQNLAHSF